MTKKYYEWKGSLTTDEEFVSLLGRKLNKSPDEIKEIIECFIDSIRELTELNTFLAIRKLGVFTIRQRKNSSFFNRATQMRDNIALIKIVHFKAAQSWRNKINAELKAINYGKIKTSHTLAKNLVKI